MQDARSDVNNEAKIDDDRNDEGITPLVAQMLAGIPSLCSNDNLTIQRAEKWPQKRPQNFDMVK